MSSIITKWTVALAAGVALMWGCFSAFGAEVITPADRGIRVDLYGQRCNFHMDRLKNRMSSVEIFVRGRHVRATDSDVLKCRNTDVHVVDVILDDSRLPEINKVLKTHSKRVSFMNLLQSEIAGSRRDLAKLVDSHDNWTEDDLIVAAIAVKNLAHWESTALFIKRKFPDVAD
jgi:hypothetical protein